MGTRGAVVGRALGTVGLVLATMALAAGCGSSSVVGTSGGPATTAGGPVVAKLSSTCTRIGGAEISVSGSIPGTPDHAVAAFLAGGMAGAPALRRLSFEPGLPPPAASPPQSVGASPSPGSISTTSISTDAVSATTALVVSQRWYVHRDSSGRVTVVLHVDGDPGGWVVDEVQTCEPGSGSSGGVTATTGTVPPPQVVPSADPPTSVTSIPPGGSTTTYPGLTTSTSVAGG